VTILKVPEGISHLEFQPTDIPKLPCSSGIGSEKCISSEHCDIVLVVAHLCLGQCWECAWLRLRSLVLSRGSTGGCDGAGAGGQRHQGIGQVSAHAHPRVEANMGLCRASHTPTGLAYRVL
jgi:hypothetical protein